MASLGKLTVEIEAKNAQFASVFNGNVTIVQKFGKATEEAKKKSDSLGKSLGDIGKGVGAIFGALSTAAGLLQSAFEKANEGARNLAAEKFFANAGKDIASYRKATAGLISDAELMKKGNLADSMGIKEDTFKSLAMVAQAAALKTGQSFDYMFNSIIVGTARSSRLLLDNLGIIVSIDVANRRYAAAHMEAGQSVDKFIKSMDDEAKKVAFADEVMRQSVGTLDEFAKLGESSAANFDRFSASIQNVADLLKGALAQAFDELMPLANEYLAIVLRLIKQQGILSGMKDAAGLGATAVFGSADDMAEAGGALSNRMDAKDASAMGTINKALQADRVVLSEILERTGEDFMDFMKFFVQAGTSGDKILDGMAKEIIRLNDISKHYDFGKFTAKRTALKVTPDKGSGKKEKEHDGDTIEDWKRNSFESLAKEMLEAQEKVNKEREKLEEDFIENERKLAELRESSMQKLLKDTTELAEKEESMRQQKLADLGSNTSSIAGAAVSGGGLFSAIGSIIGPGIGTAVATAIGGSMGGPIGAIVGALIPILGSLIDSLKPVIDLMGGLSEGITFLVSHALGELLNFLGYLGGPLRTLLAAVGLLIGGALRPLVPLLEMIGFGLAYFIQGLAYLIIVLSPFVELFFSLFWTLGTLFASFIVALIPMEGAAFALVDALDWILEGAIGFNNAMVKLIRKIPGMKTFGKILNKDDFQIRTEDEDNTAATEDNTAAVRDLAREFRNMPQGYKVASATYSAQAPQRNWTGMTRNSSFSTVIEVASSARDNVRWRL